jgi:hypothetical protein
MSHFTTVQTKIRNLMRLEESLKDLKLNYTRAEQGQKVHVKGYQGQTTEADLVVHISKQYEIGVNIDTETGNATFVADWEFVEIHSGYSQEEFTRKVSQRYAYHTVKEEVVKRGYSLEEETVDENNHIHVTVSSWSE